MKKRIFAITTLICAMFFAVSACDFLEDAVESLSEGEDLREEIQKLSDEDDRYCYNTDKFKTCSIIPEGAATLVLNLLELTLGTGTDVESCATTELVGRCVWGKDEKKVYTYFYKGENYTYGATETTYKTLCEGGAGLDGEWTKHTEEEE